ILNLGSVLDFINSTIGSAAHITPFHSKSAPGAPRYVPPRSKVNWSSSFSNSLPSEATLLIISLALASFWLNKRVAILNLTALAHLIHFVTSPWYTISLEEKLKLLAIL